MIASVYDAPTTIAGYDPFRASDGYHFDPLEAERRVKFFQLAVKQYELQQWQKDIIATLFGWKCDTDGARRYREAFIFVPRKNGKTSLTAGIAVCAFAFEKLPAAQYYCAACDLDQAELLFSLASAIVQDSPTLKRKCIVRPSRKRIIKGRSFLRAIPADAAGAYGTEPTLVVGDELHLWRDRRLKDTLHTGTAAQREPLELYITTAGYDFNTICGETYTHATKVRDGVVDDPAFLPAIYEATKEMDWKSEATWKIANPNYGVSVRKDYMETECRKAIENPAYENTFRREHLNQWTEQKTRWLRLADWDACASSGGPIAERSAVCIGLDLSTTTDLTAVAITQKTVAGYKTEWRFYIAEDRARIIEDRDRVPYGEWMRAGWVTATPGKTIDYSFVEADIVKIAEQYEVQHVGYDPYNATDLVNRLMNMHGLSCVKLPQGVQTLSAPSKELERCVIEGIVDHGANPVARWNASNCEIVMDNNGNYKLNKAQNVAAKKIDGIAALVFSIATWMAIEDSGPSMYETPGAMAL